MAMHFSHRPTNKRTCNQVGQSQSIGDIAGKLGIELSQAEINQLVQAIGAGGQRGFAIALSLADSIAGANYQLTPQLMTTLTNTLNQGSNQNFLISHLLRAKLTKIRIRKS